jgi:hypothetical protein
VRRHAVEQLPVCGRGRGWLIDYDDIEAAEFSLVLPERLPDNALDPVSAGGKPAMFF